MFIRSVQQAEFPKDLPPKYYHSYFQELLTYVKKHYLGILSHTELAFLTRYDDLSENAQCLFIRFSNRSKSCFRTSLLNYSEIPDIAACLQELLENDFISELSEEHPDLADEMLGLFTKEELLGITKKLEPDVMPLKSIKKPDLIRWLKHDYSHSILCKALVTADPIVLVRYELEIMIMKYLFFGNRYAGMTEFVIRDLGHVRYQHFEEDQMTIRFENRKEMEDNLMVTLMKETFYSIQQELPPEEIYDWFMNWQTGVRQDLSAKALPALDQLLIKLGAWMEKKRMPRQALVLYQLTDAAPSRERRVRLLSKMNEHDEAIALCEEILESPQNAEERFFSIDYTEKIVKKKKRTIKSTTQAMKQAEPILLAPHYKHRVERGAMEYYQALGYQTFFSENQPWRNLFGLLFWDIIHDTNVKAIHNPLQRIPSDFFLPDFYFKRADKLLKRKEQMQDKPSIYAYLSKQYETLYGTTNVLVSWYEGALDRVLKLVEFLSIDQIFDVLFEMALNLRENTRGFPDLFIWKGSDFAFLEIKSPTDHLSAQQLHWQHFFERINIPGRIVRIKWQQVEPS